MEMEKPMMAVPRYRLSTTHPAVVANNRELRRHLGKRKVFVNNLLAHPRLVATTSGCRVVRIARVRPAGCSRLDCYLPSFEAVMFAILM